MCKFCDAMEQYRRCDTILKKNYPEDRYKYSVAIVRRIFVQGLKGSQSSMADYRFRGCGYDLNFCPECGRRITKNSAIDSPSENP